MFFYRYFYKKVKVFKLYFIYLRIWLYLFLTIYIIIIQYKSIYELFSIVSFL